MTQLPNEDAMERARKAFNGGEFFVNGDTFDLIFRPGGGNFASRDKIVGRFACGETAYTLPSIVAELLNEALARQATAPPDHSGTLQVDETFYEPADACSTCGATDPKANAYCSNGFHAEGPTYWPPAPDAVEGKLDEALAFEQVRNALIDARRHITSKADSFGWDTDDHEAIERLSTLQIELTTRRVAALSSAPYSDAVGEQYRKALVWVYRNGVQVDVDRPDWVNEAFNEAFAPERAKLGHGQ